MYFTSHIFWWFGIALESWLLGHWGKPGHRYKPHDLQQVSAIKMSLIPHPPPTPYPRSNVLLPEWWLRDGFPAEHVLAVVLRHRVLRPSSNFVAWRRRWCEGEITPGVLQCQCRDPPTPLYALSECIFNYPNCSFFLEELFFQQLLVMLLHLHPWVLALQPFVCSLHRQNYTKPAPSVERKSQLLLRSSAPPRVCSPTMFTAF